MTPQWQSWGYTAYTSEFKASSHLPPSFSAHLAPRGFGQPPPARFPPGRRASPKVANRCSRAPPFGDRVFSYPGFSETRSSPVDPLRETVCSATRLRKTSCSPACSWQNESLSSSPCSKNGGVVLGRGCVSWERVVSWEGVVLELRICRAMREIRRKPLHYKYAGPSKASRILRKLLRDSLSRRNFAPRRR